MKKLKIDFTGSSNIAYLSYFGDDLIEKISGIGSDEFHTSDLNMLAISGITIGKGLQEDCVEVQAYIDGEQVYSGELNSEDDLEENGEDPADVSGPMIDDNQATSQDIDRSIFEASLRSKFALVEVVNGFSSLWSVSLDVDDDFSWNDIRVGTFCLDESEFKLGELFFDHIFEWGLEGWEPYCVFYKGKVHPLEHQADEGGTNELFFFEQVGDSDKDWQTSDTFAEALEPKMNL